MTPHPIPRGIPRDSYARILTRDRRRQRVASVLHAAALMALIAMFWGAALQALRLGVVISADLDHVVAVAQSGRAW